MIQEANEQNAQPQVSEVIQDMRDEYERKNDDFVIQDVEDEDHYSRITNKFKRRLEEGFYELDPKPIHKRAWSKKYYDKAGIKSNY